jgi:hypothetical protein
LQRFQSQKASKISEKKSQELKTIIRKRKENPKRKKLYKLKPQKSMARPLLLEYFK